MAWQPESRRGADEAGGARAAGGPAKLPYGGLNRIRFEGCVSTRAGSMEIRPRYPRFGAHSSTSGGTGPAMARRRGPENPDSHGENA